MKTKPILFSTEMVQAILNGKKSQTRRVIKTQPNRNDCPIIPSEEWGFVQKKQIQESPARYEIYQSWKCPFGEPGDVLWVRETALWVMSDHAPDLLEGAKDKTQWVYRASVHNDWIDYAKEKYGYKWRPSIHMPKSAARIFLQITDVRVERLQHITNLDAIREGIKSLDNGVHWKNYISNKISCYLHPYHSFESLWHSINGEQSWNDNPWVWIVEFKQIKKPVNFK